ncbi:MAG: DUF1731 domain-containing protein [Pirellulales bacterium]
MTPERGRAAVVIAGGSGFVGVSLAHYLAERDVPVIILTRRPGKLRGPWRDVEWDGRTVGEWQEVLESAAAVINLAGRSVNCIKTPEHQDEILRSRVESTKALGQAMAKLNNPPPVWIQMSTAHIYGDTPVELCTEDSAFGYGLAPFVGQAWEEAFRESLLPDQRGVVLRTSFVLGRDRGAGAGALQTLGFLTRCGLGGTIGRGTQGISWIHEHDLNRLFERATNDDTMQGPYIASAPNPVAQREFARSLRQALGVPLGLPALAWMVRLAAPILLRSDAELALCGRYVRSQRLQDEGFRFEFAQLDHALKDIFSGSAGR